MDFIKIESYKNDNDNERFSEAKNGMVSTAFPDATDAGVKILEAGGNAVDAACSSALALGVCEPQASGLGGQTMMLISHKNKIFAIDGSSRAPSLAHANSIYKNDRRFGYRAATVPSTPAVLQYVHKKFGRLPWKKIVEPAVDIAENGYIITKLQNRLQKLNQDEFHKVESGSGAKYFLNNGEPYKAGEIFKQQDLAKLLKLLAEKGVEEFYTGKTAKQIDSDMRENGGLLRYDDLAFIPWPIERQPIKRNFRKLAVYTMPPPGAGRTLLLTLMMLDMIKPQVLNKDMQKKYYLLAEIFRKSLLERSDRPYDPNFYQQVEHQDFLNRKFIKSTIKEIICDIGVKLPIRESIDEFTGETTHLSVIDKFDTAVSLTQSIERLYGSKAAAEGLGFLYNNYLMDYEYDLPTHPFYLRPNAAPWATVAPTLVFKGNDLWLAVGSPGSERIFSTISQFLIHITDENMTIEKAMMAPRMHCSLGGRISIESDRFPEDVISLFKQKGYRIDKRKPFDFYLGAIHAVLKKHDGSGFQGVAEIRRDGTAGGF